MNTDHDINCKQNVCGNVMCTKSLSRETGVSLKVPIESKHKDKAKSDIDSKD